MGRSIIGRKPKGTINLKFSIFSEFQTMINPQKKPTSPEKKSLKNLKKFLPQLKNMAKKEGLSVEKKEEKGGEKPHIKVETVLSVFKDEKVKIKV